MVENQSPSSCSSPREVTPAGDISYAASAKKGSRSPANQRNLSDGRGVLQSNR